MISMEFAKFMFKYNNQMLLNSFNDYFVKLENIHKQNTRQKCRNEYFQPFIGTKAGRKSLHHICLNIWSNIPQNYRHCSFVKFKKYFKAIALAKYDP